MGYAIRNQLSISRYYYTMEYAESHYFHSPTANDMIVLLVIFTPFLTCAIYIYIISNQTDVFVLSYIPNHIGETLPTVQD